MMNIKILYTQIEYEGGDESAVKVFISGDEDDYSLNINGYVPLSPGEFLENSSHDDLLLLVRQKASDRIIGEE